MCIHKDTRSCNNNTVVIVVKQYRQQMVLQEIMLSRWCIAAQSEQASVQPEADGMGLLISAVMIEINNQKHLLDESAYVL